MRPRWILWAAAPFGVAVFFLVRAGDPPPIKPEAEAEVEVWQFMAAASVVLWTVLASVGLGVLETLPRRRGVAPFVAAVYVAIALLLVLTWLAGIRSEEVVASQPLKNVLLHVLAGVAVLPWLVALERIRLDAAVDDWIVTAAGIERIRVLRGGLKAATAALGGIIAGAVILTGALRGAVSEAGLEPTPDAYVLVYGAWLTGVLAAIYLQVFGAIERRGRWIVDRPSRFPARRRAPFRRPPSIARSSHGSSSWAAIRGRTSRASSPSWRRSPVRCSAASAASERPDRRDCPDGAARCRGPPERRLRRRLRLHHHHGRRRHGRRGQPRDRGDLRLLGGGDGGS